MRAFSIVRSVPLVRSSFAKSPFISALHKPLSTTSFVRSASSDLVNQLSKEISYETENAPEVPDLIAEFKAKSGWVINNEPGKKEVMMTKVMGAETVKLYFNTDSVAELQDSEEEPGYLSIVAVFSKANQKGALELQLSLQESNFDVDSVSFYDLETATKLGPQGDFERAESYGGPDYEQLQPELRDNFLAFMSERGLDEALAEFIPAFLEVKEQDEYVRWLKKVKDFAQE